MLPYERFQAWQTCHELTLAIYRTTRDWPQQELYCLTAQARRAAFSAAANIAEGSVKRGGREFRRYLDISLGSLSELSYILMLAKDWISSIRKSSPASISYVIAPASLSGAYAEA
jgi:four helix bundle protein